MYLYYFLTLGYPCKNEYCQSIQYVPLSTEKRKNKESLKNDKLKILQTLFDHSPQIFLDANNVLALIVIHLSLTFFIFAVNSVFVYNLLCISL
jgi:hypothetical protein